MKLLIQRSFEKVYFQLNHRSTIVPVFILEIVLSETWVTTPEKRGQLTNVLGHFTKIIEKGRSIFPFDFKIVKQYIDHCLLTLHSTGKVFQF